ncbi:thioredoxin family protein [Actinomycetospora rhizophila]|uniref:Thioredoxin family protein n=1 Tax=Actinomycetospora rhizophila TaxID=1416876 RepID=A0ABV9ZG48_9PSEU
MRLELLYFDGCPNAADYLPRLRNLAAQTGDEVVARQVTSAEQALTEGFLGSPTVRVDGSDVEPGADARRDYGLSCRVYITDDGARGTPLDEWVLAALGDR